MSLVKKLNVPINLVYVSLKTGDLKNDIPDPAHRSSGEFLLQLVLITIGQMSCEQPAKSSMPISTPSQIAVDCKSVHCKSGDTRILHYLWIGQD